MQVHERRPRANHEDAHVEKREHLSNFIGRAIGCRCVVGVCFCAHSRRQQRRGPAHSLDRDTLQRRTVVLTGAVAAAGCAVEHCLVADMIDDSSIFVG